MINRIKNYNIIKFEIDKWDPVGLLNDGAPEDEYDIEITKIFSKIENLTNIEDLACHIYNVFLEMFGVNTETKATKMVECNRIAQNILLKINTKDN